MALAPNRLRQVGIIRLLSIVEHSTDPSVTIGFEELLVKRNKPIGTPRPNGATIRDVCGGNAEDPHDPSNCLDNLCKCG